ncbi:hypothetical protein [Nocardia sp. NBC_01388]|uniref:hypothetical protein n=1 Tax=Nocardia sp. NBC_01388 TaxID=2903596 RepID=UPI00324DE1C4
MPDDNRGAHAEFIEHGPDRDVRDFTGTPLTSATGEPWLAVDDKAWPSSTKR